MQVVGRQKRRCVTLLTRSESSCYSVTVLCARSGGATGHEPGRHVFVLRCWKDYRKKRNYKPELFCSMFKDDFVVLLVKFRWQPQHIWTRMKCEGDIFKCFSSDRTAGALKIVWWIFLCILILFLIGNRSEWLPARVLQRLTWTQPNMIPQTLSCIFLHRNMERDYFFFCKILKPNAFFGNIRCVA